MPEFITPQDGDEKQDCEYKAALRWLGRELAELKGQNITVLGDDLYSRQGICKAVIEKGWDFIFTCKVLSHKNINQTIIIQEFNGEVPRHERTFWDGRHKITESYRWALNIPIRESEGVPVNWVEIITTDDTGKQLYCNSFVTSHHLSEENVVGIVSAGRARWKIENEANNTLKNHGYHLEHNFGHGKNYLAQILLTMNILAFLFHSIMELCDEAYLEVRTFLGRRNKFFNHLEALTTYFVYENFDLLIAFMLERLRANASHKKPKKGK